MRFVVRRRLFSAAALALVAALSLVLAEGAFHTDDGCVVEIHCLACQRAHTPSTPRIVVALPVALELVGRVAVPEAIPGEHISPPDTPSRAPPLA